MAVIEIQRTDAIETLVLNRPAALNAINARMIGALLDYFTALARRPEIRVVRLKGAGDGFCAGLDLKDPAVTGLAAQGASALYNFQRRLHDLILAMRRCPQPIVAQAHGAVAGGGLALLMASDMRVAQKGARFSAAFIRIGLSGCDVGLSYLLPRLVGGAVAAELLLTGRAMDAARAHQLGLVSGLADTPEALDALAADYVAAMASTAPLGLRLTKEGINANLDAASLDAAMMLEDRNQVLCAGSRDFAEGLAAFAEKRPPRFEGR
ncbi:MAG: enoyl-CoA hydratase/isomerase family protein [Alphaproteobacteria bacterium]|nr:MAG: enoyl-CoA hydratase/isomerase family protein [Alphaproteobacteria bacterium]